MNEIKTEIGCVLFANKSHEITYKKDSKTVMIQDLVNGYFIVIPSKDFFQITAKFLSIISLDN